MEIPFTWCNVQHKVQPKSHDLTWKDFVPTTEPSSAETERVWSMMNVLMKFQERLLTEQISQLKASVSRIQAQLDQLPQTSPASSSPSFGNHLHEIGEAMQSIGRATSQLGSLQSSEAQSRGWSSSPFSHHQNWNHWWVHYAWHSPNWISFFHGLHRPSRYKIPMWCRNLLQIPSTFHRYCHL